MATKGITAESAAKRIVDKVLAGQRSGKAWNMELSKYHNDVLQSIVRQSAASDSRPHAKSIAREFISFAGVKRSLDTVSKTIKEMIDEEKRRISQS